MSKSNFCYTFFMIFLVFTFLLGMFVYAKVFVSKKEGMEEEEGKEEQTEDIQEKDNQEQQSSIPESCPDMLIQDGNTLKLYNSRVSTEEPIVFGSLVDYLKYIVESGNNCPVLYLRKEVNTQGQDVYRVRPSPIQPDGGLPTPEQLNAGTMQLLDASRDNSPYNDGNYPGFDPTSLYVGRTTELDIIHASTENEPISDNPMDPNWGGVIFSIQSVNSGKYIGNEVKPPRGLVSLSNGSMPGLAPGYIEPPVDQI